MSHNEEYNGHHLSVSTNKLGKGYVWEYLIDGEHHGSQFGDRPMSEEIALSEGIGAAKRAIDQMPKKSGT